MQSVLAESKDFSIVSILENKTISKFGNHQKLMETEIGNKRTCNTF